MACSVHYDIAPRVAQSSDLELALSEYRQRRENEQAARDDANSRLQDALSQALSLVAKSSTEVTHEVTHDFLVRQLTSLTERLTRLPDTVSANYRDQCTKLLSALTESTISTEAILTEYTKVSEAVTQLMSASFQTTPSNQRITLFHQETALLRDEITSSVLATDASAQIRAELLSRLNAIDELAATQLTMALQGLHLIRQRLDRELRDLLACNEQRQKDAESFRRVCNEMCEKLAVISRSRPSSEFLAQATQLQQRLEEELGRESSISRDRLIAIAQEVDALYDTCAERAQTQANSKFVHQQLQDTILALGMPVLEKQADEATMANSVVAGIDESHGLEFHFEDNGRIRAELVAFRDEAAEVFPNLIEESIALADDIISSLTDRQCRVRERFRHLHKHPNGHRLRVVQVVGLVQRSAFENTIVLPQRMGVDA